jgi:hypothetical protein
MDSGMSVKHYRAEYSARARSEEPRLMGCGVVVDAFVDLPSLDGRNTTRVIMTP